MNSRLDHADRLGDISGRIRQSERVAYGSDKCMHAYMVAWGYSRACMPASPENYR